jgi:orotate phosphoribosyltransferase
LARAATWSGAGPGAAATLTGVSSAADQNVDLAGLGRRIVEAAYLEGEFVLRSGRRSGYYLDKYRLATDPAILRDLATALASRLPAGVDRIAGSELGAVPLATAVSLASGLPSVFVRRQAKRYGTGNRFEGVLHPGERVVLLEDVVTTGGQCVESGCALRDHGAEVVLVLAVIDREEGAAEAFQAADLPFGALFTRTSLGLTA